MAVGGEGGCRSVIRINFYCAVQQIERLPRSIGVGRKYKWKGSHRKAVGVEVLRALALRTVDLGATDLRQDCAHKTFGDAVLQNEQITNLAVVGVSPQMNACGRIN